MPNFFGSSHASGRNFGGHACQDGLRGGACGGGFGFGQTGEAGGVGGARQHIVHGDAVDGHLGCPSFGPICHGTANGVGDPQASQWRFDRGADDIHNTAPSGPLHPWQDSLGQDLVVDQMLVEGGQKGLFSGFCDGSACRASAVVHKDVDVTVAEDVSHCTSYIFGALEVRHGRGVSRSRQRGQCLVQPVWISREQGHGGPEACQLLSRGKTNALRGTAHQSALAAQIQRQNMLFTHVVKGRQAYFGPMKRLEHLGIAVSNLEEAERIFQDVLGVGPYKREEVEDEGVLTSFFQTGDAKVELLMSTTSDGPIARHIERRGPGLHHVAFLVEGLEAEIERLEGQGYRVISGPKAGADGKRIAFLHPSDTAKVLVELCEDV